MVTAFVFSVLFALGILMIIYAIFGQVTYHNHFQELVWFRDPWKLYSLAIRQAYGIE